MASTDAPPPYSIYNSTPTHKTEASSFECIGSGGGNLESQRWVVQPEDSSGGEENEPLWRPSFVDWLNILMLLLLSMMITIDGTILVSILPVCQILCVKLYTLSDEDEVLDSVTQDERSGCILVWDGISTSMRYYATLLHCTVRLRTAAVPNASGIRAVHCWDYNMLSLEQFRANNCRSCDPRNRCRRYNVGNVYITSRPDTAQRAAYLYCIPIYFQSAKLRSATSASITLIPITAAILPAAAVTGILITRFGYIHWPLWLSWIITAIATGCLISWDTSTTTVQWVFNLIAVGVGQGITLSSLNSCVQVLADPKDTSHAFAMYAFIRTVGMCVGVPVGGTIFSNRLKYHAHNLGLPDAIGRNVEGGIEVFKNMTATAEQVEAFKLAYARAFRNVAEVLTGLAVLGLIISMFVRRVRL
ncbi:unnamed protein product [Aspergillus oryzae]|nr:unnamed protein product [Aspergillus oryzae]